jgi:Na+-translocating ferredoxin:NAD+ oxidoreductase RnfC subunit
MRSKETAAGSASPALPVRLREMGVVGAGGAGFPAHVKAASRVEYVLANGAECEPLVHKDVEIMKRHPEEIVAGMSVMMEATGAKQGKFGIKEKNSAAVEAVKPYLAGKPIELALLGDFYPSGDEYELVYSATGRLIPPAGIPLQVGCVVNNVETLYNVQQAAEGRPVTRKFVSVSGAVRQPKAFWTPIGTPLSDLIAAAGGATVPDYAAFVSGIMMGSLAEDLDAPVTKTTAGLIVLPRSHYLIERRSRPEKAQLHIGKSACDQCSYCTEFCPRYLLGYDVRPHQVMRSLGFTKTGEQHWNQWGQLCCACGICTLYACPEDLYPKEACDKAKRDFRGAGLEMEQAQPPRVHPMKEFRRIPLAMLRRRLKIEEFESETPFDGVVPEPGRVRVRLLHGAGKPAAAVVTPGNRVSCGQTIARIAEGQLGADVHASIDGSVAAVTDSWIEIVR